MSARKHSTRTAGALLLLAVLAAGGVFSFTQFTKAQLQSRLVELAQALDLELTLAGDIQLKLIQQEFVLQDLRLNNPEHPQELASVSELTLRLSPWQLQQDTWQISEVSLSGLYVNQRSGANGSSLWSTAAIRSLMSVGTDGEPRALSGSLTSSLTDLTDLSDSAPDVLSDFAPQLVIDRLLVSEASLDVSTKTANFSLRDLELELLGANLSGQAFQLQGQTTLARYSALNRDEIRFPLTFGGEAAVALASAFATVNSLRVGATPLLAEVEAQASWTNGDLTLGGAVAAQDFDLNAWMLSLEPDSLVTASLNPSALPPQLADFAFDFSLNDQGFVIQDFDASLGEGVIDAQLAISSASEHIPANIRYAIRGSTVDFSFLDAQRAGFWSQLPRRLLLSNNLDSVAAIDIQLLRWGDSDLAQLRLFAISEAGVTEIELLPVGVWGGQVEADLRVDSSGSERDAFALDANIAALNTEKLIQHWPLLASFGGELSADLSLEGALDSSELVAESLRGEITFDLRNNRVPLGLIKQVFSTIAALSPVGGSTEQWPEDLSFSQLSGFALLDNGLTQSHRVNLLMDNLEIEGNGVFDPATAEFDYSLSFTLLPDAINQSLQINEAHIAKPWPVNCAANLSAPVSQYCSPDFAGVRELFAQPEVVSPVDALLNAVPRQ
jgi:hypothetical protein